MPENTNRMVLEFTTPMKEELHEVKSIYYGSKSESEMLKDLIARGVDVTKKKNKK
ncbi:MAG: hypothetical protein LKM41_03370 [Lachnospiraceae bacterium]|nr:hypothetical protein [Lachnospiraceae bacterium]